MKKIKYLFLLVAVGSFAIAVFWMIQVMQGYGDGRKLYQKLAKEYVQEQTEDLLGEENETTNGTASGHDDQKEEVTTDLLKELPPDAPNQKKIDFQGLLSENEDVVGWLDLPVLNLSYPVVQGADNEFYLHHALNKEYLYAGSIFMDFQSSPNLKDYHTILYGHNMRDGSMFAPLKNLSDQSLLDQCPYFWFYQQEKNYLYQIFSVYQSRSGSETYIIRFKDDAAAEKWRQDVQEASMVESSAELNAMSRVMTLSTCTGNGNTRWVVMGKLIWTGSASSETVTAK